MKDPRWRAMKKANDDGGKKEEHGGVHYGKT
jgi:hypothetical protein